VVPDGLKQLVNRLSNRCLQIIRPQVPTQEVLLNFFVSGVQFGDLNSVDLDIDGPFVIECGKDNTFDVVDNWIAEFAIFVDLLGWTVSILDLLVNVGDRVFHENGRVGVGLAHLDSSEAEEHVMRDDDWLDWVGAVVPRQHVDFALVHAKLAHVGF